MQALPYIVLGVFATVSCVLYFAGCGVSKNWYPLFVLFPAAIAVFLVYALYRTLDDMYEPGCFSFTSDSSIFLLAAAIVVAIALPCTFYQCGTLDLFSLLMHLAGDLVAGIGVVVFLYVSKNKDYSAI